MIRASAASNSTPLLVALLATAMVVCASPVHAQRASGGPDTRPVILWVPLDAADRSLEADALGAVLRDLLAAERERVHLVGAEGVRSRLTTGPLPLPDCFAGLDECRSAQHAALSSLGVTQIVFVEPSSGGSSLHVRAFDPDLRFGTSIRLAADDLRGAVFRAIHEVTGATAQITVRTEPSGASIVINGEGVGTSPVTTSIPIGSYLVEAELDGYFATSERVELRAGEGGELVLPLSRRFAALTIRSGTPGAEVFVGDEEIGRPIGEPIMLEPGDYTVVVRAPEHTPQERAFSLVAGEDRERSINLELSPETIKRRRREQILARPFLLEISLPIFAGYESSWASASASPYGRELEIECAGRSGVGCGPRAAMRSFGIQIDTAFTYRYVEVEPIGFSVERLALSEERDFLVRDGGDSVSAEGGARYQLRFLHGGGRYLVNHIVEPFGRTGFTLAIDRLNGRVQGTSQEDGFRRTSLLWELRAGTRLHVNQLVYATTELGLALNLTPRGDAPRFFLGLGVGMNVPDFAGLTEWIDGLRARRDREAVDETPQEL